MKKVIILGAGVGGLTAAHYLIKEGIDVHVYERHESSGGQARSKKVDGKHTEYCWHAFSKYYNNLLKIMKSIPYNDSTVYNNLRIFNKFVYARENGTYVASDTDCISQSDMFAYRRFLHNMHKSLPICDYFKMSKIFLIAKLTSEEKLKRYDSILWIDYVKHLSKETFLWVGMSPCIYLGMDISRLSAYTMLVLFRRSTMFGEEDFAFYSLNGSFNEKFFDPWVNYLKNLGVHFHFNSTITNINIKQNYSIENIDVKQGHKSITDSADIYVNGLPIEQYAQLMLNGMVTSKLNSSIMNHQLLEQVYNNMFNYCADLKKLADLGRQIQTQVIIEIDRKVKDTKIIVLPDTKWFLMIKVECNLWDDESNLLSVGIGLSDAVGINGKKLLDCTVEEVKEECITQIWRTNSLLDNLEVICPDGSTGNFSSARIVSKKIWHSFQNVCGTMTTYEPKFTNSVGTWQYRPEVVCCVNGLYNATSYTKTKEHIFNMESACEAGITAVEEIKKSLLI